MLSVSGSVLRYHRDMRSLWLHVLLTLSLAITLLVAPSPVRAGETLKIGTLAPAQSPWGRVFSVWKKAVKKKTKGKLDLQFFWNGQQGDEGAMIGKIKAGQLDAAAVSAIGMSKVYKPILALQTPGLFRDWASLDRAREALRPEFEKGIRDAGFEVFGWGDIGKLRVMSKGFAVRVPSDLKGKLPLSWRDDSIGPVVYQTLGVTPVPLNVPEVLPALNTGKINVLSAPALAAEQLQWASRLDHVGSEASVMAIGSMVWSKGRVDALPGDLRTILTRTGALAGKALSLRIRQLDDEAYGRLSQKMTVVTLTDAERAKWKAVFEKAGKRLSQGTFSPELMKRLVQLAQP